MLGSTRYGELMRSSEVFADNCNKPAMAMAFLADSGYSYLDIAFMRDYMLYGFEKAKELDIKREGPKSRKQNQQVKK